MKVRSNLDFAGQYGSYKQGVGTSTDNFLHVKEETTAGTFRAPSIGTQGSSISAAAPSSDISAGTADSLKAAVDGNAAVTATIASLVGLDTGAEIAAALETAINAALLAAGYDARVWAEFAGGLYKIYSQKTGTASAVVITAADANDLTTDLKLGLVALGTEAAGTAGADFLLMTKASMKVAQPFEMSPHKSGRQASSTIKKKISADGDVECLFNLSTGALAIDTAVALLLETILGRKTVSGAAITFDAGQAPNKYFTAVQGSNIFGRSFNGGYGKSLTMSFPGDGEAKFTVPVKFRNGLYASIGKINGAVNNSANVILENGESPRFDVDARVMVVDADGRTVLYGADGSLKVNSRTDAAHTLVLSGAVTVGDNGFVVPFMPHVFDQVAIDNPVTGLQGSVSLDGGSTTIEEIRSAEVVFDPKVEDLDKFYGSSTNMGRVVSDRAEIKVKVELTMSASQMHRIVQSKEFLALGVKIVLGPADGRRVEITLPKVLFSVPPMELPDSGSVVATLEGVCLQSASGRLDAISIAYK